MVGPRKINIYPGITGEKEASQLHYIEDAYEVSFYFDKDHMPHVEEIGGRLEQRANALNLDWADMHISLVNEGSSQKKELCLGSPRVVITEMKKDASVRHFFKSLLIPYLYYHSYWEKHGEEPWRGLRHDAIGILQDFCNYKESVVSRKAIYATICCLPQRVQKRLPHGKMAPEDLCFCGSDKPVKSCHPEARKGFNILIEAYRNNPLKIIKPAFCIR